MSKAEGPNHAPKIGDGLGIIRINTRKKMHNLSSMIINTGAAEEDEDKDDTGEHVYPPYED